MTLFHFKTRLHCAVSLIRLSFFTLVFMVLAGCAESGGGTKAPVQVGGGDNSNSDNGSDSSDGSGNNIGDNGAINDDSDDQTDSSANNTDGYG